MFLDLGRVASSRVSNYPTMQLRLPSRVSCNKIRKLVRKEPYDSIPGTLTYSSSTLKSAASIFDTTGKAKEITSHICDALVFRSLSVVVVQLKGTQGYFLIYRIQRAYQ